MAGAVDTPSLDPTSFSRPFYTGSSVGEALAHRGVSIEGGGAFVVGGTGIATFSFPMARSLARRSAAGIPVLAERDVLVQRLNQLEPGQLGKIARRVAEAGVNIEVMYSDHHHQLILVVDDVARGRVVSETWRREERPSATRLRITER